MFEKFLHQTPFIKFVFPLILGIILKINLPPTTINLLYPFVFFFIVITTLQVFKIPNRFIGNRIWSILIFLALFNLGALLVQKKELKLFQFKNQEYSIVATVIENPVEKEKSVKTTLKINSIKDSVAWINPKSKVLVYFEKDSLTKAIKLGDKIYTKSYINEIKHSGNPFAFNYKEYLRYKDIHYQIYIKKDRFKRIDSNCGSQIILFSNNLRQKLLSIYQNNQITGNEFAVLSALSLGYKTELTPELKESFSTSGAMHVLAVSGLHVGIIFIILTKLLFFLNRNKHTKLVQSFIVITVLLFYATITGLSSSVIRATIMFSFICIGKTFTRQVNIYNSISASAFIMLLYNPYTLMDVGFQLSYLAVISIVFFQPKIYSLFTPKHKLTDYIWQLVSVAIAAQIGTFPITIHYFEQFPVYFILSNILIIPIVSIIIYGAILLFIFSFSFMLSALIAKALNWVTWLLNTNVEFIEQLPFSKITGLIIERIEIYILIAVILFLSFFIIKKQLQYVRLMLYCLSAFAVYNIYLSYINSQKSLFIVYNIPQTSSYSFIDNKQCKLMSDSILNSKNIEYNILPLIKHLGIRNITNTINSDTVRIFNSYSFHGKRILHINNNKLLDYKTQNKLPADYIILSENTTINIADLTKLFEFKSLIFDASNSHYKIQNWEKECKKLNLHYHSIADNGAFILSI